MTEKQQMSTTPQGCVRTTNPVSTTDTEPETGIATEYWLELLAYPEGDDRSLWLLVNGDWRCMDEPSASVEQAVMMAFTAKECHQVKVCYCAQTIVGLIVCTPDNTDGA